MTSFLETHMSSDIENTLQTIDPMDFACRFFQARGAAMENGNDKTRVLMPGDLAQQLSVEELITISTAKGTNKPATGQQVYPVMFHTPLLDKIAAMAGVMLPFLAVNLQFDYIKTQGFDRLVQDQFELYKTKLETGKTGETKTRYMLLTCHFKARSDEIKEGLLDIAINRETGALVPDMVHALPYVPKQYSSGRNPGCTQEEIDKIRSLVNRYGPGLLEDRLSQFVKSMNRRFQRDAASLDTYYKALEDEMAASLQRSGISEDLVSDRKEKIAMIPRELAAKKKDLFKKYSIVLDFQPVAALDITSPCVTVFTRLLSGHRKQNMTLTYNPVTKKMDPAVCQSCGESTYSFGCCENMHLNCPSCIEKGCSLD